MMRELEIGETSMCKHKWNFFTKQNVEEIKTPFNAMLMSHDMMMVFQLPYFWCDIMNEDVELKISSLSITQNKIY
jgi:hypothetical protein